MVILTVSKQTSINFYVWEPRETAKTKTGSLYARKCGFDPSFFTINFPPLISVSIKTIKSDGISRGFKSLKTGIAREGVFRDSKKSVFPTQFDIKRHIRSKNTKKRHFKFCEKTWKITKKLKKTNSPDFVFLEKRRPFHCFCLRGSRKSQKSLFSTVYDIKNSFLTKNPGNISKKNPKSRKSNFSRFYVWEPRKNEFIVVLFF
mgnify:CR=1 FL=1